MLRIFLLSNKLPT